MRCLRRSRTPRQAHLFGDLAGVLEPIFHHSFRLSCIVSDYVLMTFELGGFLSIAALLIGLFAWLRQDMSHLRDDIKQLAERVGRLEHSQAKLEGLLEGLREAITGRPVAQ